MKATTKKLLSVIMAVLMLAGTFAAVLTVNAEEAATIDLANYNETTGYVINNIADWKLISEASFAGETFKDKKFTLGADIDAKGATLPTLFNILEGEFNGNGKTVKNAVATKALIAYKTREVVKIHDVTFDGITVNHKNEAGTAVVVAYIENVTGSHDGTHLNNVVAKNCTVNAHITGGQGAILVGYIVNSAGMSIKNSKVENGVLNGGSTLGLAMGSCHGHVEINNVQVEGEINVARKYVNANNETKYAGGDFGGIIGGLYNGGQTVTIKNSTVAVDITGEVVPDGQQTAMYVGLVAGRQDKNSKTTIENVTVMGSFKGMARAASGVIGATNVQSGCFLRVRNVKVNADLSIEGTTANNARIFAAGVICEVSAPQAACGEVLIENVKVEGRIYNENHCAAGIMGVSASGSSSMITDLSVTIRNCEMLAEVVSGGKVGNRGIAALVGIWGGTDNWSSSAYYSTGTLLIENCVIAGNVKATGNANCLAAVIGQVGYLGPTNVVVQNCVISTTFEGRTMNTADKAGCANSAGVIVGRSMRTGANMTVNNVVHTYEGVNGTDFSMFANLNNMTVNGVLANKSSYQAYTDDSIVYVTPETAAAMVKKNDQGFITRVGGQIVAAYVQDNVADGATLTANDTYAIRFIALSQITDPAKAGITVVVKDANGNVIKTFDTAECVPYDRLLAYTTDGATLAEYNAVDFGASKFLAVVIRGIPGGAAYTFEVTPHYTTEGGIVITGETVVAQYDANGQKV